MGKSGCSGLATIYYYKKVNRILFFGIFGYIGLSVNSGDIWGVVVIWCYWWWYDALWWLCDDGV